MLYPLASNKATVYWLSKHCLLLLLMSLLVEAKAQITFSAQPADAAANCNYVPRVPSITATSSCAGAVNVGFAETRIDGNCSANYQLQRTWTATDRCSNVLTHRQILTISDTQAPIIAGVPGNVTVPPTAIPGEPTASAIDFCDTAPSLTMVKDSIPGACGGFSLVRTYTAADACGNTRTRQYVITVSGQSPPVILGVTPGGTLACGSSLPPVPTVTATDVGGTPLLSMRRDTLSDRGGDTCRIIRRLWTATNSCGLSSTASQVFVFLDGQAPVLSGVPRDTVIYCEALPPVPALYTTIRATDSCDPTPALRFEEVSERTTNGSCSDVNYRVIRTWTAFDACGNASTGRQILTIKCECCSNGIDDDDDGLIDDYDPQCNCFAGVESECDSVKRYFIPPVLQTTENLYNQPSELVITTLSPQANITITTADGSFIRSYQVRKGAPLFIPLTTNQLQTRNHDRVERNKGWVITSDQLIQPIYRIDAFYNKVLVTVKGPQALGRVFRAGSQTNTCGQNDMNTGEGHFISVMATEDDTEVTINARFPGLNGLTGRIVRNLNRYETYLIRDDYRNTTISGTLITSTKPIAVTTGSQHTRACRRPSDGSITRGQDGGVDQLVPNCLTGDEYVLVRGKENPVQQYAILVANKNNTRVVIDGDSASAIVLQAGEYRQVWLDGGPYEARHFKANKAFYAYQVAGISTNNEVGMAICGPVGECKGDTLIEFPKFSGNSGGQFVDNAVYLIMPTSGLASLRINGAPYTSCAIAEPVPSRPDLRVVTFEDACLQAINSIRSNVRFTAGMMVGVSGNTGTHGYLTSFKDRMEVRSPNNGRPVTAYLVDTLCGSATYSHCLDVSSCATAHNIAAVRTNAGTVTLDGGTCLTYNSPADFQGLDQVLVTVQNDQGLFQTVCLSFFVCASPPNVVFPFIDTTVSCANIPPLTPPSMSDECGSRVTFRSSDVVLDGSCAYAYIINRHWTFWDDCGDSTQATQIIRVYDNAAPQALNVPSDTLISACAGLPPIPTVTFYEDCDNSYQYTFRQETIDSTCLFDRTILRSWEAWDACGNRSTAVQRIILRDTAAPIIAGAPADLVLACGADAPMPTITASDDCDPNPTIVFDSTLVQATCDTFFNLIRRWTATDQCGRVSTVTQRVLKIDLSRPVVINVPADTSITCGESLPIDTPIFTDDCTTPVPIYRVDSVTTGTCPIIEVIYRTWTAIDNCGRETSARQVISILDSIGPQFTPLPDTIFSSCLDSVVVIEPQIMDDCNFLLSYTDSMAAGPGCNGERLLYRSYLAEDGCGRTARYRQLYYFRDAVPPIWVQQPSDVVLTCSDPIPTVFDPSVVDACSGLNPVAVRVRDSSIVCPATRWIYREYTVSDWCGNLGYFTHTITINGCEPAIPVLATGQAGCTGEDIVLRVTLDSGYVTPLYQWHFSSDGVTWTVLSQPADSSTLTIRNANPAQDGYYRVNIANTVADLATVDCSSLSNPIPITVRPPVAFATSVALCRGDTLFYLGDTLTNNVTRTDSLLTWYGCDSIATLNLTVFPFVEINIDTTLCVGESLSFFGQQYNSSGTFSDTLITAYGCDSLLSLKLRVLPDLRDTFRAVICSGQSYPFEGQTLRLPGTYTANLTSVDGCDSTRIVTLSVQDSVTARLDTTICSGESLLLNGENFTAAGVYRRMLTASSGCDSILTIRLSISTPSSTQIAARLCFGEIYWFGDQQIREAGSYTRIVQNRFGCDSTINLNLSISPRYDTDIRAEICEGEIYRNGLYSFTQPGRWPMQFYTADGCDSTVNVTLVVYKPQSTRHNATICFGDSYSFLDTVLTSAGQFLRIGRTRFGCDSTVTLDLAVVNPSRILIDTVLCFGESLTVGTQVISSTMRDSILLQGWAGCDSLVVVDVYVHANTNMDTTAVVCFGESLNVNGNTYSQAGRYVEQGTNQYGCDSTWTLYLSVFPELRDTLTQNLCAGDTLNIGGRSFTTAGNYSFSYTSSNGCDSIIVLSVNVLDTFQTVLEQTICEGDRYDFFGRSLSQAGQYRQLLQSQWGCDSTIVIDLRVAQKSFVQFDTMLCSGERLSFGGRSLSQPGLYIDSLKSVENCDSIIQLRLDYFPIVHTRDTVHVCEGDGYDHQGNRLTRAGEYSSQHLSEDGCDSTYTLLLTVHPNVIYYDTLRICHQDSFLFNGEYLREAGSYVQQSQSRYGCDSTYVLELLITDEVLLATDDAEICAGSSVTLRVRGYNGPVSWSPAIDLSCTSCPNPIASPRQTITYTVEALDCSGELVSATSTVTVLQPVDVKIVSAKKLRIGENTTLKAVASDPSARLEWREGNTVLCTACDEIVVRPLVTTIYEVEASNGSGCDDTERLTLIVEDECSFGDLEIPNILTPNGDGANDYFEIRYTGLREISLLRIYNRWGELVFETHNIDQFWDGTHRGQPVNPGVFMFYLEGYCLNDERFTEQGNVTVVR